MDVVAVIRALRPSGDVPSSLPEFSRAGAVDLLGPGPVAWAAGTAGATAALMADFMPTTGSFRSPTRSTRTRRRCSPC